MVLKEVKTRRKNVATCWIDYRKACDVVPHSWIMECLTIFKIANNVQNLLQFVMPFWKLQVTSNNQQRSNKKRNLPRGLPITSTIHN